VRLDIVIGVAVSNPSPASGPVSKAAFPGTTGPDRYPLSVCQTVVWSLRVRPWGTPVLSVTQISNVSDVSSATTLFPMAVPAGGMRTPPAFNPAALSTSPRSAPSRARRTSTLAIWLSANLSVASAMFWTMNDSTLTSYGSRSLSPASIR